MRGKFLTISLSAFCLALAVRPAFADYGDVGIGKVRVFMIRVGAAGKTRLQRTEELRERLPDILTRCGGSAKIKSSEIRAVPVSAKKGANITIMIKKYALVTVTAADARANGATVKQVANQWVKNLRKDIPEFVRVKNPKPYDDKGDD